MAQPQTTRSTDHERALTLVELLVVLALVGVLLGLLLPSISRVRNHAITLECSSRLRSIGRALAMYAQDWDGRVFPYVGQHALGDWRNLVAASDVRIHCTCPLRADANGHGYVMNTWIHARGIRFDRLAGRNVSASDIVLGGENLEFTGYRYIPMLPTANPDLVYDPRRHGASHGSNYLWLDTHVSSALPRSRPGTSSSWDIPPR